VTPERFFLAATPPRGVLRWFVTTPRRWLSLRRFDDRVRARLGIERVCGADEVGRGPLAGPLVAAAVVLPPGVKLAGLDDSKALTPEARAEMAPRVREAALAVAWAIVGPRAVDRLNTHAASLLALRRAVTRAARRVTPQHVLVDGAFLPPAGPWTQEAVVDGDARSLAVAAASVIAKTVRDGFMCRLASEYPAYGFERHKGYATPEHLAAIVTHGPCIWHRFSFEPVRQPELPLEFGDGEVVEVGAAEEVVS
jgi:ribonuclease HII